MDRRCSTGWRVRPRSGRGLDSTPRQTTVTIAAASKNPLAFLLAEAGATLYDICQDGGTYDGKQFQVRVTDTTIDTGTNTMWTVAESVDTEHHDWVKERRALELTRTFGDTFESDWIIAYDDIMPSVKTYFEDPAHGGFELVPASGLALSFFNWLLTDQDVQELLADVARITHEAAARVLERVIRIQVDVNVKQGDILDDDHDDIVCRYALNPPGRPTDVADFIGVYGWRVLEHLGYEELAERYVKPTGRKLESMALERVVYAEKL